MVNFLRGGDSKALNSLQKGDYISSPFNHSTGFLTNAKELLLHP